MGKHEMHSEIGRETCWQVAISKTSEKMGGKKCYRKNIMKFSQVISWTTSLYSPGKHQIIYSYRKNLMPGRVAFILFKHTGHSTLTQTIVLFTSPSTLYKEHSVMNKHIDKKRGKDMLQWNTHIFQMHSL
jgi:hypothetical protein